jgi:hypothetical protein
MMTDDENEYLNERAGILQFDAGYQENEAVRMAFREMIERRKRLENERINRSSVNPD